jgi:hypothetical protein
VTDRGRTFLGAFLGIALAAAMVIALGAQWTPRPAAVGVAGKLLPEASGPLREVLMHYVPGLEDVVEASYTDFLRAVGTDVKIDVVVPKGSDLGVLDALLRRIDASGGLAGRVTIIPTDGPITTWSKDRALVARSAGGLTLVAPAEPSRSWAQRHNDWQTVESVALFSRGRLRATYLPLDFDAGDVVVDDGRIIVDGNFLEKNQHRGVTTIPELKRRLVSLFRVPVLVLGQSAGDTPRHHLAMYMTTLTDGVVLVGDIVAARSIVGEAFEPGDASGDTGEPLRADFSDATRARFDRAARDLEAAGYRVERIPNVPFDDKTYISYTNGVFETRGGSRIAYMPVYGLERLDAAARAVYERLGWQVRPIRVKTVYPFHGTIGCLVNVIDRG